MVVVAFYGKSSHPAYWGFSNFYPAPFVVNTLVWATSEHFYQASKYFVTDPQYAEQIRLVTKPREAFNLGRDLQHPPFLQWDFIKDDMMRIAVAHKFSQHADLGGLLLSTNEAYIVEASPVDSYWGEGPDKKGRNMLGQILMEVRGVLRADCVDDYLNVSSQRVAIISSR